MLTGDPLNGVYFEQVVQSYRNTRLFLTVKSYHSNIGVQIRRVAT